MLAEDIVVRQAIAEEAQTVLATAARFHLVRVHGEAGDHRDVGIDRMPDRHAFLPEDAIVVVNPLPRLAWVDERKRQCADAVARRHLDGLAVGARHPQRRVRLLQRFRHHVAAGHVEEFALETGIGVHHQHVGALLDGLKPHPPLLGGVKTYVEASEFHQRCAFAGAELDAAVRDEIKRGDTFGDAGGVVIFGRHQADAMAKPDPFRALRAGGQENLRRRGVRIFFKEVMLDFPCVIDTKSVGQLDLVEGFLEQPVFGALGPWPRQLVLVENAEFHGLFRSVA